MKIVHLSQTPVAGSPIRIVDALNFYTALDVHLITAAPYAYGLNRVYSLDINWQLQQELSLQLLQEADVVHVHQYFSLENFYNKDVEKICNNKICIRQLHSAPFFLADKTGKEISSIVNDPTPQLVIAQFQERFYPKARVVPNIVELPDLQETSQENPLPVVSFATSTALGAWESRWDTKGYPEVCKLLHELKAEGLCEIDIITDTPHEECLRRKQAADIILDDMVTGSYHLNGLEGLAAGKPVLGWLDTRVQDTLKALTGAPTLPWVNVHLEDAGEVLRHLLLDRELRETLGQAGRQWMEQWYHPQRLVKHYVDAYNDLLEHPEFFTQKRSEFLGSHWNLITMHDILWESRRKRACNKITCNSL